MRKKVIILPIIFISFLFCTYFNAIDGLPTRQLSLKEALALASLKKQHKNPYVFAFFENDTIPLLKLSPRFEHDPEGAERLANFFEYKINSEDIPLNQEKTVLIHKDKPFNVSLVAARGQITPLVAFIKTQILHIKQESILDKLKFTCCKILDFLSFRITFECPVANEEQSYCFAELLCAHDELSKFLNNPNQTTLVGMVKNISWPDWRDISVHLPELKKH